MIGAVKIIHVEMKENGKGLVEAQPAIISDGHVLPCGGWPACHQELYDAIKANDTAAMQKAKVHCTKDDRMKKSMGCANKSLVLPMKGENTRPFKPSIDQKECKHPYIFEPGYDLFWEEVSSTYSGYHGMRCRFCGATGEYDSSG